MTTPKVKTSIVDKNGKPTTVYRNAADDSRAALRLKNISPERMTAKMRELTAGSGNSIYTDDPHNTHYEVSNVLARHIPGAQQLVDLAPEDDGRKVLLESYREINREWQSINSDAESLAEVSDRMKAFVTEQRAQFDDANKNMAFDVALRNITKLEPIPYGEEFTPRRGRTDISPDDKRKIASLTDVGGIAEKYLGITLGTKAKTASFTGRELGGAMQWILVYRQREVDIPILNGMVKEFLDPEFNGDVTSAEFGAQKFRVPMKDISDFLIEMSVVDGKERFWLSQNR